MCDVLQSLPAEYSNSGACAHLQLHGVETQIPFHVPCFPSSWPGASPCTQRTTLLLLSSPHCEANVDHNEMFPADTLSRVPLVSCLITVSLHSESAGCCLPREHYSSVWPPIHMFGHTLESLPIVGSNFQPETAFCLDRDRFLRNLRCARRGAGHGRLWPKRV